jgi:guanosine-3',5'-bis(diphosphate) 3'-pyrophosphohydrolase
VRHDVGSAAAGIRPADRAPAHAGGRISEQRLLLAALHYAAQQHANQRRKGATAHPYINHPIAVAELLARVGGIDDTPTLMAALLHDTIEDTGCGEADLQVRFGYDVTQLVLEVTDDKSLPKGERKRRQEEHAPQLSPRAKAIKLADKLCNVTDIGADPPESWDDERKFAYFDWADRVVAGLRGTNAALEALYDERVTEARRRTREAAARKKK